MSPVLETRLFWGQKVKGQGRESHNTVLACVFALL